jgi:photosystem II stability/assembly factor-like uncharacterized protein
MSKTEALKALNIRVWITRGGVHPYNEPQYLTLGKFSGDPAKSYGEATRIGAPDPQDFNRDVAVGSVEGSDDRATFQLASRYTVDPALLLEIAQQGCRVDVYGLAGKCGSPTDFEHGGEKWVYFEDGRRSQHGFENFGAFAKDENNPTNENLDMTAEKYWEMLKMATDQLAEATTTGRIMTIDVCDDRSCGDCGKESEGCNRVLATMVGVGATPGTQPTLLYSDDSGLTFSTQTITTMFSNEELVEGACIGGDLVLLSTTSGEFHYTNVDDIYKGVNTWSQVGTGFVAAGAPNAMWSSGARYTWVVGDAGYIYFASNPRSGVSVLDAGEITTENLNDVHACDTDNVLVVGNSNTVLISRNGGKSFDSITGPSAGVNLGACWMWDADTWFVGEGAGGAGVLYKTRDGGYTWQTQTIPGTMDRIDKIVFVSDAEGYLSGRDGGSARLLRTITGGYEWWDLPERAGSSIPGSQYLTDLAVCEPESNVVFAAGLATDGTAGMIIKGSGPDA